MLKEYFQYGWTSLQQYKDLGLSTSISLLQVVLHSILSENASLITFQYFFISFT